MTNQGATATAAVVTALSCAALILLAGCSSGTGNLAGPGEPAATRWVCSWDPTINDDWHDDYLCTNGAQSDRPRLLPDDPFVDRSEIDQAAAEYEDQLNS